MFYKFPTNFGSISAFGLKYCYYMTIFPFTFVQYKVFWFSFILHLKFWLSYTVISNGYQYKEATFA